VNIGRSYKKFGLNVQSNGDILYNEWAPQAKSISIFGDFNNWNREEFWAEKNEFGVFSLTLKANDDGTPRIPHNSKYKISIEGPDGRRIDRNSAWARF
jgi:1,4-alpha-glucan branching enzyme